MKKLFDLDLEMWFLSKNKALCAACANATYYYEVVKETEKAIQILITSKERNPFKCDWYQWIPKSAIRKEY